jgi:hypothetical protein
LDIIPKPKKNIHVKYISIGWSNYGEIYIVADKRMPNTIFLLFRGTNSWKTTSLYSKPTSFVPLSADGIPSSDRFVYGIFKPTVEVIHTVIESMTYLATKFLNHTQDSMDKVKIFSTGHSLGGAMCTIFSYLWANQIKKNSVYDKYPYNVLADEIICITIGSPKCMSELTAQRFCNYVITSNNTGMDTFKKILYIRIVTQGDPITGLPPKMFGFRHPCFDSLHVETTKRCNGQLTMYPSPNMDYNKPLNCTSNKEGYYPNLIAHLNYVGILFGANLQDLSNPDHTPNSDNIAREVWRTVSGDTVCRLIMGSYSTNIKKSIANYEYNVVFFNLDKLRKNTVTMDNPKDNIQTTPTLFRLFKLPYKIGGPVLEDVKMTPETFKMLLHKMYNICSVNVDINVDTITNLGPCGTNICPLVSIHSEPVWSNFEAHEMPELSISSSLNSFIENEEIYQIKNTTQKKSHTHKKKTRKNKK